MTQKEMFNQIKNFVTGTGVYSVTADDIAEFCDSRIEQLNKKHTSTKPSKNQIANAGIKAKILNILTSATDPLMITDIQSADSDLAGYSNQKITSLLTQLISEGLIKRGKGKGGKPVFSVV